MSTPPPPYTPVPSTEKAPSTILRLPQFLVGPDGRTVKRYSPLTLASDVIVDAYQMRVAGDCDTDFLPSSFDSTAAGSVPVTGRWRRRLTPAANATFVQGIVTASAILALFLHPSCAASPAPPQRAAVDAVLLASAIVLLSETLARFAATALPYSLAKLGFWVGVFTSCSLALDISFLAGGWAVRPCSAPLAQPRSCFRTHELRAMLPCRGPAFFALFSPQAQQTHWKVLTAIRAARVARVMRLYAVVMHWRHNTVS